MPTAEAQPQACLERMGERALVGRVLLAIVQGRSLCGFLVAYDVGNVWLYFRSGVVQQFAKILFG